MAQAPPPVTSQAQGPPQPGGSAVQATAEALASPVPPATLLAMLAAILGGFGVTKAATGAVLFMVLIGKRRAGVPASPGPALRAAIATEDAYRAAYLVNAAVRVQNAVNAGKTIDQAIAGEQANYALHVQAVANRRRAAAEVDKVAEDVPVHTAYGAAAFGRGGTVRLAGWRAKLDSRTSQECRAADGKNFRIDRPPIIGYPGTVHPHCRCHAVKPFRAAPVMDPLDPVPPHR